MKSLFSFFPQLLRVATAYKAKILCSGIFVSGRDPKDLLKEDLAVGELAILRCFSAKIDWTEKTVTVSLLGRFESVAVWRRGLGSTLVQGATVAALKEQEKAFCSRGDRTNKITQSLPVAKEQHFSTQLNEVVKSAFTEEGQRPVKNTRAVVVLHKGEIVAERYVAGFSAETPMLGWSMAKSVVNALIGILVKAGKLSLTDTGLLEEWRGQSDPRDKITLDQLLRMSSGLRFSEVYTNPQSDVMKMLFQRGDSAKYVSVRSLKAEPGSEFFYSGGSTVLLCRIIREAVGGSLANYFAFPQQVLFDRIEMTSAVLEPDAAGTFTGSSFMYATARDWAKFGLLYLQDGCWKREGTWQRILPEGWVAYSTAPSELTNFYGAHFWRGVPNSFTDKERSLDGSWPKDAYLAAGYQGQFVTVVPSQELVVVRLGLSQRQNSWDQVGFIAEVVKAIKGNF